MSQPNVLIVLRSFSVLNDSRLLKQFNSLKKSGFRPIIISFGENEKGNNKRVKINEIYFKKTFLERIFGNLTSNTLKSLLFSLEESFWVFFEFIKKKPSYILVHDHRFFFTIALLNLFNIIFKRKIQYVWDLRELPNGFMNNFVSKKAFEILMSSCLYVLFANDSRKKFLEKCFNTNFKNAVVINNFVSKSFINASKAKLPLKIKSWLSGSAFLYVQNPHTKERFLNQIIFAVSKYNEIYCTDLKIVISGKIPEDIYFEAINELRTDFDKLVLFTGFIPEHKLIMLFDNAIASIVLYDKDHPNRDFAEPNRLYQSFARGCPFLVGSNSTLTEFAQNTGAGITLVDDGKNIENLLSGISSLISQKKLLSKVAMENRFKYSWEKVEQNFINCFKN